MESNDYYFLQFNLTVTAKSVIWWSSETDSVAYFFGQLGIRFAILSLCININHEAAKHKILLVHFRLTEMCHSREVVIKFIFFYVGRGYMQKPFHKCSANVSCYSLTQRYPKRLQRFLRWNILHFAITFLPRQAFAWCGIARVWCESVSLSVCLSVSPVWRWWIVIAEVELPEILLTVN